MKTGYICLKTRSRQGGTPLEGTSGGISRLCGLLQGLCPLDPRDFFEKKSSKNFIPPAGGTKDTQRRFHTD